MTTTPTQPPLLPDDVSHVGRPLVLVTGAQTLLGRAVTDELRRSHVPSRAFVPDVASPAADATVRRSLSTGAGLDLALPGAAVVIHCASDIRQLDKVDVRGTRNLIEAMTAWAPDAHLIVPSAIGAWDNPHPYFRARANVENLANAWAGPTSVLRVAPWHHTVRQFIDGLGGRLRGATRDIEIAPLDVAWCAQKMVDIALMREHLPLPIELAGPETLSVHDVATLHDHITRGQRRASLAAATHTATMRAFTRGRHLPGPDAVRGGQTYSQWLMAEVARQDRPTR